jgi:hypothetical protein
MNNLRSAAARGDSDAAAQIAVILTGRGVGPRSVYRVCGGRIIETDCLGSYHRERLTRLRASIDRGRTRAPYPPPGTPLRP